MGGLEGNVVLPQSLTILEREAKKNHFPEDKRPRNRLVGVTKVSFPGQEDTSNSRRKKRTQNYRFKEGGGEN